ncbi:MULTISPECIES: c-type cytochrome [Leptolyngbya]|uniref:Cytochrome c class I n=1 Tax=Leptolyngbya boryana NIES-2135 TaxID=1973484 RepID=A0A1Z4JD98_LEPBY|nr:MULTISPECIES: cytochrome c [Leptolyngbya]MBD1854047.1 cytochrome c [Leptolyngbya sp. FACHB-1624]MBD2365714.1 cytochrome c [Leptolyngbya sp. FACHB-161]MBD2371894.1 cytochrome c [Leptolyngbya sp. FACHB-238]MBD2396319.1 cytochrome c [Leptolyngbya sp. FACHB-239]MBD2402841.1 cytochrome c [Leptolyngbya sp. FACHB-402]MBN8560803.1 cytochrome c [Leptolyngbya sp. UWPOB_LEPTO1]BAY54729.1 cytochrome c class I [Leptolyngbya boryana NIES-2135]
MNEQLVKSEGLSQRIITIVLVVCFAIVVALLGATRLHRPDPYVQEVLSLHGDSVQGHAIFQINCAGCHGIMADGKVGPSLKNVSDRKSPPRLIKQVISGQTPPMPKFQPSPQEMADLLSYLESL